MPKNTRHVKSPSRAEQTLEENLGRKKKKKQKKEEKEEEKDRKTKTYMNKKRRRRFGICPRRVIQFLFISSLYWLNVCQSHTQTHRTKYTHILSLSLSLSLFFSHSTPLPPHHSYRATLTPSKSTLPDKLHKQRFGSSSFFLFFSILLFFCFFSASFFLSCTPTVRERK